MHAGLDGLLLQAMGVVPLAVLSFLLSRSIPRDSLRYFWRAWTSLALSLFALFVSLRLPPARGVLEPLHFLGEMGFAAFILAGCRNLATGLRVGPGGRWLVLPAAVLALVFARSHADPAARFVPQALVMAVLFGLALREVWRVPPAGRGRIGTPLLQLALGLLVLRFGHSVPLLSWSVATGTALPAFDTGHVSLLDLLLETLLGFGTLIAVFEREHQDLQAANQKLSAARERLEAMARTDPLTSSLTRHAFYSMVQGTRTETGASGCVAVVDIDALKPINDAFGHAAGDAAIRAVARAIRKVVRADDLVFRWGGDEFLAVLFGLSEDEAGRRLDALDAMPSIVPVPGSPEPLAVTVSVGAARFGDLGGLERAIEVADERMYLRKLSRRTAGSAAS